MLTAGHDVRLFREFDEKLDFCVRRALERVKHGLKHSELDRDFNAVALFSSSIH
jgi:hypothetical protein